MNDAHLEQAARQLVATEPDLAKHFTLAQIAEHLCILTKRLKLAAAMQAHED